MRTGVLLINLGSPSSSDPDAVSVYLRQFLMDPLVIDLPWPIRWPLVNGLIVPLRKNKSAAAYRKIWREDGSPLVRINRKLTTALQSELGTEFQVELGMRYGEPSIELALHAFRSNNQNIGRIYVLPLYPQYAASSTETAIQECMRAAAELHLDRRIKILPPFYNRAEFIQPAAARIQEHIDAFQPEHLLFSYHGLPVKAVKRECESADVCLRTGLQCAAIHRRNENCYRAQCYATTRHIQNELRFPREHCSVGFQSRLTHKWIQPFSDARVVELAKNGCKKLAVVCPSFTADCLETLEEVAIQFRDEFLAHGGEELRLIPAVNDSPDWVRGLAQFIRSHQRNTII